MDPDVVKELNEQIRQLNEMLSQQATAMSGLASSMTSVAPAMKNAADATSKSTTSQNNNTQSINKLGGSVTKLDEIQKKSSQNMNDAAKHFAAAAHSSGQALRSFKDKLLSAEEGFGKYGDAITKMGDSAFELGKSFGVLGTLFGGALKVGSIVLDYQSKQADALFSATDEISRLGAAGTFTVEEIRKMGAGAGLASAELEKLINPMKSVQGGFAGLGGSQSEGIKKFGQLAAVSEDTRREFKRLGMGDQERNQALADYISMMNKSGAAFSGNLKTQQGLQKAALGYTRNLYELAEITGKDTATVAKERETLMASMEVALQQNKWEEERKDANKRLREAKTDSEKRSAQADLDRIEREKAGFDQFNNELQQSALSAELKAAAQQQFLTGVTSTQSAIFKMYGVDLNETIEKAKNNKLQKGELAQTVKVGMQKTLDNLDQRTVGMSEDVQKAYGFDQESIAKLNQQMHYDLRTTAGRAAAAVKANQAGTGVAATDPAQEMRNDLVEAERKAKLLVDDLAASMNPFLGNMGMLKAFGGLAALAAAGLATVVAAKGLSGLLSFFKKGDAAALPGAAATPGAAPSATASAGPVSIQEDQLLDKNGKPLRGAARDARMWKLAGDKGATVEPAKKGIGGAIKGIAKSLSDAGAAAPGVIKGAGALAVAITEFGAGIAGAVWIFSKALPSFADGLKSFKEVDPMNLLGVGLGMVGLGAGILAMGAGTVASAIGSLAKLLTGGKDPFEDISHMLFTMSILDIDPKRVEDNSEALVSFAKAMAAISGLGALSGIGNAIKGISESFGSLFGSQTPLEQLVEFSELSIDAKQTKNNALAFKYFAEAMASYEGLGSDVGAIGSVLADATAKFFDVKPPLEQAVYFSHLDINKKKTEINAKSFVLFSEAMSSYKGGPGLLDAVSTIAGAALYKLFQREGPMESFKRFTEMKFGENALKNSTAFFNFAKGIAILSSTGPGLLDTAISAGANIVGAAGTAIAGAAAAVGNFFTGDAGTQQGQEVKIGNEVRKGGTVSWRTNNPGNVSAGPLADSYGAVGRWIKPDGDKQQRTTGIAIMPTYEHGLKLKMGLWRRPMYQPLTMAEGVSQWVTGKARPVAPHTASYAKDMAQAAGVPVNFPLSKLSDSQLRAAAIKQEKWEGFKAGTIAKARSGGVFTGPKSGYPIEMHGTEMVIPSTPNSVLTKLAQSSSEVSNMTFSALRKSATKDGNRPARDETTFLSPEMILDLAKKFDNVIGVLEDSQDTNHKILKHSMA
jgi:hypothetical protein